MRLSINSKSVDIGDIRKIKLLLEHLEVKQDAIALAINGEHVLRSEYDKIELEESMQIDIISPMVGG